MDERAVLADPPAVVEIAMRRALAHGQAAEDGGLEQQRLGACGKLDVERSGKGRAVEDDGFLRQPGDAAACADGQPHPHLGAVAMPRDRSFRRPGW